MDELRLALALHDYHMGVSLLMAWFCLEALDPETVPDTVRRLRDRAADRQVEIINSYHGKGIRDEILLIILAKKLRLISGATTLRQVREMVTPPRPTYQGGVFKVTSPYYVEEEELVLWSIVSADQVLRHEAKIRALHLFDRYLKRWAETGAGGGDAKGTAAVRPRDAEQDSDQSEKCREEGTICRTRPRP